MNFKNNGILILSSIIVANVGERFNKVFRIATLPII